jgi:hypothetical protein
MSTNPPAESGRFLFLWIGLGVGALLIGLITLIVALWLVLWSVVILIALNEPVPEDYVQAEPIDPADLPEGVTAEGECLSRCYTVDDAIALAPSPGDLFVGTTVVRSPSAVPEPAGPVEDAVHGAFYLGDGTPVNCDFSLSRAPGYSDSNSYMLRDGSVIDLGTYGSTETISQSAKVFELPLWASRYPDLLGQVVDRCQTFSVQSRFPSGISDFLAPVGTGVEWSTTVERIDLPVADDVVAVAWLEESSGLRVTTADLQCGTIVVRTTYTRPASDAATEGQQDAAFAAFVLRTSERLADLG